MTEISDIESVKIPRAYFNRDQIKITSMEAGLIYPIDAQLLLPNDLIELNTQAVIRQQPTRKPSYTEYRLQTRTFVVAIRNLWKDIYRFMTGYKEYSLTAKFEDPLPTWTPSDISKTMPGTLWDMLGYPTDCIPDKESLPMSFWKDAYNYIWDLYFRDQTKQDSILVDGEPASSDNEDLLRIGYDNDYFIEVLPFQALTDPIALPLTGETSATFNLTKDDFPQTRLISNATSYLAVGDEHKESTWANYGFAGLITDYNDGATNRERAPIAGANVANTILNKNIVSMENVSSVLISDLRYAFALQLYAEMNARGGIRDNEFLLMHYGTAPSDETLGRPKYLGGSTVNILTSEVLQTSETSTTEPLGQMGGHGLGAGEGGRINYHAKEFCVLLTVAYIKPNTIYGGQGMPKEFSLKTLYDFPLPIFGHLSEQPVYGRELMCKSTVKPMVDTADTELKTYAGDDQTQIAEQYNGLILGYNPVYEWARKREPARIHGLLKMQQRYRKDNGEILKSYNLYDWADSRIFDIETEPRINTDFIEVKIDNRNFTIIDDTINRSQFIVWFKNDCDSWRPISKLGTPGRIDHII